MNSKVFNSYGFGLIAMANNLENFILAFKGQMHKTRYATLWTNKILVG